MAWNGGSLDAARELNEEFRRGGKATRGRGNGRRGSDVYGGRGGSGNSIHGRHDNADYTQRLATAPPAHLFKQHQNTAAVQTTQPTPIPQVSQPVQTAEPNDGFDRGGPMDVDEVAPKLGMGNSRWGTASASNATIIVDRESVTGPQPKLKANTPTDSDAPTGLDAPLQKHNIGLSASCHNRHPQTKPTVSKPQNQTKPTVLNVKYGVDTGPYIDKDWLETDKIRNLEKHYAAAALSAEAAGDVVSYRLLNDVAEFAAEVVRCRVETHDAKKEQGARANIRAATLLAEKAYGKYQASHAEEVVINKEAPLDGDGPKTARSDAQFNRPNDGADTRPRPLALDHHTPGAVPGAAPQVGQPAGFQSADPQRKSHAIDVVAPAAWPQSAETRIDNDSHGYPKLEVTQQPLDQHINEPAQERTHQQYLSRPLHQPMPTSIWQDPVQQGQAQQTAQQVPLQQTPAQQPARTPWRIPTNFDDPAAHELWEFLKQRGNPF